MFFLNCNFPLFLLLHSQGQSQGLWTASTDNLDYNRLSINRVELKASYVLDTVLNV